MVVNCVSCGQPIEAGDYRLVGVEKGTWASQYAHRGNCEAEARERFASKHHIVRRSGAEVLYPEEVEELTLQEPEPLPSDGLPWFGMERRR